MSRLIRLCLRAAVAASAICTAAVPALAAETSPRDTAVVRGPEVVVSATRTPRRQVDVPNATTVVTGEQLRARGTRTMGEALQDIVGIDTGEGSDNGSRLPNVGMWGLKEFDALLFTLNGVPVGGPFNPSLSQIPVEDIDRIEVVKGPQGTLYGVSAFAGMVQVFTRGAGNGGEISAGGGSFSQGLGHFDWGKPLSEGRDVHVTADYGRSDGWQDRTASDRERGGIGFGLPLGSGRLNVDVMGYRDRQDWGSPLPFSSGALEPDFVIDRNYAMRGAKVEHQVVSGTARLQLPIGSRHHFENTFAITRDAQDYVRSFAGEIVPDTLESEGLELTPKELSLYEDVRAIWNLVGAGAHELVTGAALTWGKTNGKGREFEFDQAFSAYPDIPAAANIPSKDDRDFEDMRIFLGVYAHDAWTPKPRLTLEGGARFDLASEELETEVDLPSGPVPVKDNRDDTDISGDVSALVRLVPPGSDGPFTAANIYGSVRRAFKPAAPNLAEAEAAEILEPEHTTSWEVGLKTRSRAGVAIDLSYFDMRFENMVVSILGAGGGPELTNAGKQRFKGFETNLRWSPEALHGSTFSVGYAHHNARFEDFTFVTPDSQLVDVSGKKLELVPDDLVNGQVSLQSSAGIGGWFAVRYQGKRPFNRRNTFFADSYTECDAGLSFDKGHWRVSAVGRNLGDDRHVVTESEIGDAAFYIAPPRRFIGQVGYRF